MESLRLSFEAVFPIFILMLLGYIIKRKKLASKENIDAINKLCFRVFLPTLLFYNIYQTESMQIFNGKLIAFIVTGVLLVFAVGYFAVLAITKDNAKRGVMIQGFFRSNYAILGVPLVEYICRGGSSGLASLMVAIVIPMFNVLAVVALERFRGGNVNARGLLKGILTNPLIIGCVLGILFLTLHVKFPPILEGSISDVAKIATPLSIIAIGANFAFSDVRGYVRELTVVVFARLIFVPMLMVSAAALLGFRGEALACVLIVFGAPVAISSFAMSQQMGGDEKLSALSIILSSALCLLTLFGWIFLLNALGLF